MEISFRSHRNWNTRTQVSDGLFPFIPSFFLSLPPLARSFHFPSVNYQITGSYPEIAKGRKMSVECADESDSRVNQWETKHIQEKSSQDHWIHYIINHNNWASDNPCSRWKCRSSSLSCSWSRTSSDKSTCQCRRSSESIQFLHRYDISSFTNLSFKNVPEKLMWSLSDEPTSVFDKKPVVDVVPSTSSTSISAELEEATTKNEVGSLLYVLITLFPIHNSKISERWSRMIT